MPQFKSTLFLGGQGPGHGLHCPGLSELVTRDSGHCMHAWRLLTGKVEARRNNWCLSPTVWTGLAGLNYTLDLQLPQNGQEVEVGRTGPRQHSGFSQDVS